MEALCTDSCVQSSDKRLDTDQFAEGSAQSERSAAQGEAPVLKNLQPDIQLMPSSLAACSYDSQQTAPTCCDTVMDVLNAVVSNEKRKLVKRKGKLKSGFDAPSKRKGRRSKHASMSAEPGRSENGDSRNEASSQAARAKPKSSESAPAPRNRDYERRKRNAFDRTSFLLTELKRPGAPTTLCGRTERTSRIASERRQPDEVARFFSTTMFERFDESTQLALLRFLPRCDVVDNKPTRDAFTNLAFRSAVSTFMEALKRGEYTHLRGISFDALLCREDEHYDLPLSACPKTDGGDKEAEAEAEADVQSIENGLASASVPNSDANSEAVFEPTPAPKLDQKVDVCDTPDVTAEAPLVQTASKKNSRLRPKVKREIGPDGRFLKSTKKLPVSEATTTAASLPTPNGLTLQEAPTPLLTATPAPTLTPTNGCISTGKIRVIRVLPTVTPQSQAPSQPQPQVQLGSKGRSRRAQNSLVTQSFVPDNVDPATQAFVVEQTPNAVAPTVVQCTESADRPRIPTCRVRIVRVEIGPTVTYTHHPIRLSSTSPTPSVMSPNTVNFARSTDGASTTTTSANDAVQYTMAESTLPGGSDSEVGAQMRNGLYAVPKRDALINVPATQSGSLNDAGVDTFQSQQAQNATGTLQRT